jgi:hypothetical protein
MDNLSAEPIRPPASSMKYVRTLNELLRILCSSLPAYLADAKPWAESDDAAIRSGIENLAADQRRYAHRVGELIVECGGRPDPGQFAMHLSAKNDLSIGYLCREVMKQQEQDIREIERCAARLEDNAPLHALAEEILGNAKGHLDILAAMMKNE